MELNENTIKSAYKLMEMITKDYYWYHDTPEQPFFYTHISICLINPKTKQWMLYLTKSGRLWYYYKTYDTFSKYLNMEESDFQSFIKIWVEDVLERGVVSTSWMGSWMTHVVEDALERGVVSTTRKFNSYRSAVEDALERGVVSTDAFNVRWSFAVEDVLKNGKQLK